jgi:hypothetical protein
MGRSSRTLIFLSAICNERVSDDAALEVELIEHESADRLAAANHSRGELPLHGRVLPDQMRPRLADRATESSST